MLKVWGRRNSLNVQKVMWLIAELSLPHEHINAGGSYGGLSHPDFLRMNPHGKVPVIEDGGVVVWESHSIVRYLSAMYSPEMLWPMDPSQRSLSDRWMDWTLATLQKDFIAVFWNFYRTPEDKRDWGVIHEAVKALNNDFMLLNQCLERQDYLAGKTITMAEFTAGALLYRYFELEIERPGLPNVEGWYARLAQRKPYREHVMLPFDDLKGRLSY